MQVKRKLRNNPQGPGETKVNPRVEMNFLSIFFQPARQMPAIYKSLLQQTRSAYLKNPLPSRLKEQLFAYLSRYCHVPYNLICHSCMLYTQGMSAQQIEKLLSAPPVDEKALQVCLEVFKNAETPVRELAQLTPELDHALFQILVYFYLHIQRPDLQSIDLEALLGVENYHHILLFFGYLQACMLWSESHPTISHPQDKPTLHQLEMLLQEAPNLALFFQNYQPNARAEISQTQLASINQQIRINDEFATMFELMTDGIIFYDIDGKITRINRAAREILDIQQSNNEWEQENVLQRMAKNQAANEFGERIVYEETALARILKGEIVKGPDAMDFIIHQKNGEKIIVSTTGAPIYQHNGGVIGAYCQLRDVTERRQLEQQTRRALGALIEMAEMLIQLPSDKENEPTPEEIDILAVPQTIYIISERIVELVQKVLNCSRISIMMVDEHTQHLIPVAQRGSAPKQVAFWWKRVKTMTITELLGANAVERLKQHEIIYPSRAELPEPQRFDRFNLHHLLVAPIMLNNQLFGIMTMDTDVDNSEPSGRTFTLQEISIAQAITQLIAIVIERDRLIQQRAEAQANELALRQINLQLDEFISIISHELRTPLTTITICLQMAMRKLKKLKQEKAGEPENLIANLEKIEESLGRANSHVDFQNRLIGDLLDVSRIQSHKMEMRMEHCDLHQLVREIFEEQQVVNSLRSIRLLLPSEQHVLIKGDATRLEQVIMNYLGNALKYSLPGTSIEARLQIHETHVCFALRDEGPGLSPEDQKRIWERFYQVNDIKADTQSSGGMGLGLHICRNIIEQHGGQVGIESQIGQGSTFWFKLPLLTADNLNKQASPQISSTD